MHIHHCYQDLRSAKFQICPFLCISISISIAHGILLSPYLPNSPAQPTSTDSRIQPTPTFIEVPFEDDCQSTSNDTQIPLSLEIEWQSFATGTRNRMSLKFQCHQKPGDSGIQLPLLHSWYPTLKRPLPYGRQSILAYTQNNLCVTFKCYARFGDFGIQGTRCKLY
jgi:hypothetical protein